MELTIIFLLLVSLAHAGANFKALFSSSTDSNSSDPSHYQDLCRPKLPTDDPDLSAPCNAASLIYAQCQSGLTYFGDPYFDRNIDATYTTFDECLDANYNGADCDYCPSDDNSCFYDNCKGCNFCYPDDRNDSSWCYYTMQDFAAQQVCFCGSEYFDLDAACQTCSVLHGELESAYTLILDKVIDRISTEYCVADATATTNLGGYIVSVYGDLEEFSTIPGIYDDTASDVIGTSTDVTLYFTPSITGTDAYVIPKPTLTSAPSVEHGQIKATAVANTGPSTTTHTMTVKPMPAGSDDQASSSKQYSSTVTVPFSQQSGAPEVTMAVTAVIIVGAVVTGLIWWLL